MWYTDHSFWWQVSCCCWKVKLFCKIVPKTGGSWFYYRTQSSFHEANFIINLTCYKNSTKKTFLDFRKRKLIKKVKRIHRISNYLSRESRNHYIESFRNQLSSYLEFKNCCLFSLNIKFSLLNQTIVNRILLYYSTVCRKVSTTFQPKSFLD